VSPLSFRLEPNFECNEALFFRFLSSISCRLSSVFPSYGSVTFVPPVGSRVSTGRLCSSRLWSFDHGAPPAVPSTPSFIPFLPTISATSTPGAKTTSNAPLQVLHETSDAPLQVITAPHPSTGTTPRSLSAQHDSTAPDSALPNALFSSRVRSSGTGEGDYGEQTQDNLFFDDGLTSFPAVRPDLVQFFLWNAMSGRLVACPTSRIMSFHSTRRIFAPLIAFPATTWLSVVDIHLAILNRGNSVVY
jgi:hypothetical protein